MSRSRKDKVTGHANRHIELRDGMMLSSPSGRRWAKKLRAKGYRKASRLSIRDLNVELVTQFYHDLENDDLINQHFYQDGSPYYYYQDGALRTNWRQAYEDGFDLSEHYDLWEDDDFDFHVTEGRGDIYDDRYDFEPLWLDEPDDRDFDMGMGYGLEEDDRLRVGQSVHGSRTARFGAHRSEGETSRDPGQRLSDILQLALLEETLKAGFVAAKEGTNLQDALVELRQALTHPDHTMTVRRRYD